MPDPTSADWLSEVLEMRIDGVRAEPAGEFSSTLTRLHLSSKNSRAPGSLILKSKRPGTVERAGESFALEARFYQTLASRLDIRTADCFAASELFVLLEDLHCAPISWQSGPSEAHMKLALAALRRQHDSRLPQSECSWVPDFADEKFCAVLSERFERGWRKHDDNLVRWCPEFRGIGKSLAATGVAGIYRQLGEQRSLLHGDAHHENLPLLNGEDQVAVLDWHGPRIGSGLFDVACFMAMSYPPGTRKVCETPAIEFYLGRVPDESDLHTYGLGVAARAANIVGLCGDLSAERVASRGFGWVVNRCLQAGVDHQIDQHDQSK